MNARRFLQRALELLKRDVGRIAPTSAAESISARSSVTAFLACSCSWRAITTTSSIVARRTVSAFSSAAWSASSRSKRSASVEKLWRSSRTTDL